MAEKAEKAHAKHLIEEEKVEKHARIGFSLLFSLYISFIILHHLYIIYLNRSIRGKIKSFIFSRDSNYVAS